MPQLDFYTFNNQFIFTFFFFLGVYYFILLYFFPKIRWLFYSSFYQSNFYLFNAFLEKKDKVLYVLYGVLYYKHCFIETKKQVKYIYWRFLFFPISFKNNNNIKIFTYSSFSFLFSFIFLDNLLNFSAERLMFSYFLIFLLPLIYFFLNFIFNNLNDELIILLKNIFLIEKKFLGFIYYIINQVKKS